MTVIIGLGYRKRSGKGVVASSLVARHGFTKLSFAEPLKTAAMVVCGFTHAQVYGDGPEKEAQDAFWGWSPRWFLQRFGTEVGRAIDPDLWVRLLFKRAQQYERVVVDDMRFPNEADAIRKAGGLVVRIDRPGLGPAVDLHASETALADYRFDRVLVNDGTLADLDACADRLAADAVPPGDQHAVVTGP